MEIRRGSQNPQPSKPVQLEYTKIKINILNTRQKAMDIWMGEVIT